MLHQHHGIPHCRSGAARSVDRRAAAIGIKQAGDSSGGVCVWWPCNTRDNGQPAFRHRAIPARVRYNDNKLSWSCCSPVKPRHSIAMQRNPPRPSTTASGGLSISWARRTPLPGYGPHGTNGAGSAGVPSSAWRPTGRPAAARIPKATSANYCASRPARAHDFRGHHHHWHATGSTITFQHFKLPRRRRSAAGPVSHLQPVVRQSDPGVFHRGQPIPLPCPANSGTPS